MDNIFRYTEKQIIQSPLQTLYDLDQIIQKKETKELLSIKYFKSMKNFIIRKLERDLDTIYHVKLKNQKQYGYHPILKKLIRQWLVIKGNGKDIKSFKIIQKSKEHIYQNQIQYFLDKGINFNKFKDDSQYQKNLYRAHNQFLNFYLNKNFTIDKSFKYYFLADTCYNKFLKILPKLKIREVSDKIIQSENLLLLQLQYKKLKYFIGSYSFDYLSWIFSDEQDFYFNFDELLDAAKLKNKLILQQQFTKYFDKNKFLKEFCFKMNLSVVFYIENSLIIFETFIYNDQTQNQFPPFFVEQILTQFILPYKKIETHMFTEREKLNKFIKEQYLIYDQQLHLNYDKKLFCNIILENKTYFKIREDNLIFYQCYFSQQINTVEFIQNQIEEQEFKTELVQLINDKIFCKINMFQQQRLLYFYYFIFYNKFQKKQIKKYKQIFFQFNKVAKFNGIEQQIYDWNTSLYKKYESELLFKKPTIKFKYKGEVCQNKFIKIIFIQQIPYQICEDFKLNVINFLAQKNFLIYRIQDYIQNKKLQKYFKDLQYQEKRNRFKKKNTIEIIQQIVQEIKYIYRKKFCIVIDQYENPKQILNQLQSIKQYLQYEGFSTNLMIINSKNQFPIKNLELNKQQFDYFFSMEMIYQFLKQIKINEKINYSQAIDICINNFQCYLEMNDPMLENQKHFQVISDHFYCYENKDQVDSIQQQLILPFFQMLMIYSGIQNDIKNLKYHKLYKQHKDKFITYLQKIDQDDLITDFKLQIKLNFVKENQKVLNCNKKDEMIKFKQNIIYYAVFFNKNIEIKFKLQLTVIESKLKYVDVDHKQILKDFTKLQYYKNTDDLKFDRNQHMTVCYLGNKEPNKDQQKIIDSYIVANKYKLSTKYMVFIKDKIGFFMLQKEGPPSCNKFKHSTIYYCGSYLPQHSNDMAERVEQEIELQQEIYSCQEQNLKVYNVKDLFDEVDVQAYVWEIRIELEGIFNFILGNFNQIYTIYLRIIFAKQYLIFIN